MTLSWLSSTLGINSQVFEFKYSVIISRTNPCTHQDGAPLFQSPHNAHGRDQLSFKT
jgi:hypothetical protein